MIFYLAEICWPSDHRLIMVPPWWQNRNWILFVTEICWNSDKNDHVSSDGRTEIDPFCGINMLAFCQDWSCFLWWQNRNWSFLCQKYVGILTRTDHVSSGGRTEIDPFCGRNMLAFWQDWSCFLCWQNRTGSFLWQKYVGFLTRLIMFSLVAEQKWILFVAEICWLSAKTDHVSSAWRQNINRFFWDRNMLTFWQDWSCFLWWQNRIGSFLWQKYVDFLTRLIMFPLVAEQKLILFVA